MAFNRVLFCASILYSVILVLNSTSYEPSAIFDLICSATHLINTDQDYSYSVIYSNVMKGVFFYSIATVFLSTTMTFSSSSSLRDLISSITRHWKPFVASLAVAVVFPAVIQPPSTVNTLGNYFTVALLHAFFVVYCTAKLVTMPMLEEKYGKDDMEVPKNFAWRFIFWQFSVSILQIGTPRLSEEAYEMQVFFGLVGQLVHMVWLACFCEMMVITVFTYEKTKKKVTEAEETVAFLAV